MTTDARKTTCPTCGSEDKRFKGVRCCNPFMGYDAWHDAPHPEAPSPFTSGMSGYINIRVKPPAKSVPHIHNFAPPPNDDACQCDTDCRENWHLCTICGKSRSELRTLEPSRQDQARQPKAPTEPVNVPQKGVSGESLSTLWDGNSLPLSPGEKIAYRGIAQTVWDAAQKSQAEELARLQQRNEAITWACEQREKLQEAAEAEIARLQSREIDLLAELSRLTAEEKK